MQFLWSLAVSIQCFLFHSLFLFTVTNNFPFVQPMRCHEDQSYALLQFKEGFVIKKSASYNAFSYPKIASWNATIDCCSWDGIECDEHTGHVIGIDLRSSQLYGYMNSNSSLFSLVHLRSLDLADNDFNHSQISSRIGDLSKLRYLNLSQANFFGQIPQEVSHLSNLLSLDLCSNTVILSPFPINLLQLKISTLTSLIQNSTNLEILRLDYVIISSTVPVLLSNLTSLQQIHLYNCELYGEFPDEIFHLPNLRFINVGYNRNLAGKFPDFRSSSRISTLKLQGTSFYGTLPASIGNLKSLSELSISKCNFFGSIPSSLGNLTQLRILNLRQNKFKGDISLYIANLTKLRLLIVGSNEFTVHTTYGICRLSGIYLLNLDLLNIGGEIPSCFLNLTQLSVLSLHSTNLSGKIPSWIMNLTNLAFLDLRANILQGEIPNSLFKLENLESLFVSHNLLEGELELDKFLEMKMLDSLALGFNKFPIISKKKPSNISHSRIQLLGLSSCNLVEIPSYFRDLGELSYLDMSNNNVISLPRWMWGKNRVWIQISVSNNSLTGKISPLICNLPFLESLDLSFNNLSGRVPSCLGALGQFLQILRLQGNKLFGPIPQTYTKTCALRMIDLGQNNFQGQLPRQLANCRWLEYLDVSHNHINGTFPFWLGTLPELKLVALSNNQLYGSIECPSTCTFPKLHIMDLSNNEFSGSLPSEIIHNWKSMKASNVIQLQYEFPSYTPIGRKLYCFECGFYSVTLSNKGRIMVYQHLQNLYYLITIDLSSNRISGEIPEVIGDLTSLVSLNLSNNMLTGSIPYSLGKLSKLESLDLSLNGLTGKIPEQLTQLTFLSFLNVSFNNLSGPIPENKQLGTFQENSFEGNEGLCGNQLMKKCAEDSWPSFAPPSTSDVIEFDWKVVLIGYVGGLVAGLVLGNIYSLQIIACLKRVF